MSAPVIPGNSEREAPVRRSDRAGESVALRHRAKLWHVLLIPLCLVWVYPFIWVATSAFKSQREMFLGGIGLIPEEFTLDNITRAWDTAGFASYTINTVVFSLGVVAVVLFVSATAGYALGRGDIPGKKIIVGILIATMFIPDGYTIIPVFVLVDSLGLNNNLTGAVLAAAGPVHVVPILLFMGYFAGLPQDLEEAARMDGAGFLRIFWRIMLPLAQPVIGTVALFRFIGAWNAFLVPLVFTLGRPDLRTLGVGMYSFFGSDTTDWAGLAAGALISLIPVIVVFLLLQRTFIEGMAGAVKS
ncbi:carbohydrate ABC transporter permease [Phytoactinopolyspora endophytica]|uniref:carbohydrate ABC transporter permease n=1 Tax=Phytoactinopolyspora endophytica TaxID=1642495 RepID=UPI00101BDD7F|nr:carbohydrate ABC transporter permease [Phytoactinopolyspora endophytica]